MAVSGTQPLRLVLDANIVVAGFLWNGPPRRLIEAAIDGQVELYSSPVLLDELAHTLGYSKFAVRIERFGTSVAAMVVQFASICCPSAAIRASPSSPRVRSSTGWRQEARPEKAMPSSG